MHTDKVFRQSHVMIAAFIVVAVFSSFIFLQQQKPTLFIIGDSTVKNGDGTGKNNQMGWGTVIHPYFDTSKLRIQNHAIGGRSSRTFITEGRWDRVLQELKPGDFVIMQFGHNDAGPLDDTARARGSIRGIGEESREIYNPIMKKQELVHTYGWYMRKYVRETKSKGAIPIICLPIPRNDWENNKVKRAADSYGKWSQEVAVAEGAYFIDLNNLVAERYESMGAEKVSPFFPADHTHTNKEGAILNAAIVAEAIKSLKIQPLNKYLALR